ncbi:acetamidase/formamidase family protein [Streptomyces sp. NBC_01465]|uniref:acetamidase/formamidase family protein n=1 Tax=Streptomyces sp. NBC_01465 TaxID=2903878 RepID=UPI002E32EDDE|nr:acetamidase/formamidase family protein [Streptomyces sp. NBC_01465]
MPPHIPTAEGHFHLPTTAKTGRWGTLPHPGSSPVLIVGDGETVTVDTVSHEGILEDQGRDPVAFFGAYGVAERDVLTDARDIAASALERDPDADGPHVVTGPISVTGAVPGDLLKVETLSLYRRADYGIVSSRHGRGALPAAFPAPDTVDTAATRRLPSGTVSTFCEVRVDGKGRPLGVIPYGTTGRAARFPLRPFMGVMGVTPADELPLSTVPPGSHGGNLDVKVLDTGTALYLPVQVDGAGFYTGDPHYAQGNGEVALTALEAPLRATFRLTVLKGAAARRAVGLIDTPFGESDTHWVAIGLHKDLNEAMRASVRAALTFLTSRAGMDAASAYAYLSAAADLEISQVVDQVQGVHCLIRKSDIGELPSEIPSEKGEFMTDKEGTP